MREVRRMLFSGLSRPGARIDQDSLARQFGISRVPVREALIVLEGEGLVEHYARRGYFVASITRDDVRDHYAVYGAVAGLAARRAASMVTPETLAELTDLVTQMEQADADQAELNFRFHRAINLAGGSRRLAAVLRNLVDTIPGGFFEGATGWPERARQHHRDILEALRRGDADAAAQLVEDHLSASGDYAVALLERAGFWEVADQEEA
ncbi:MAG: FCD domain-containing protein [Micromonosporaceae bacterium]|nr:FCD domain-containing protein [Micromonosporaceae bacterium]